MIVGPKSWFFNQKSIKTKVFQCFWIPLEILHKIRNVEEIQSVRFLKKQIKNPGESRIKSANFLSS